MDVDLLAKNISNDALSITDIFRKIFSIECNDALRYDLESLKAKNITEFKEYHGVNIYIYAYLDKTKIPVSIDIGFGDEIYSEKVCIDFPTILNMDEPKIFAYSIYSAISETFEAFVSLGLINSRFKDFYDIYMLIGRFDLSGSVLQKSIVETFSHRNTSFDDIVAFDNDFVMDADRQNKWQSFIKKKKALEIVRFEDVMIRIKTFLFPVIDSIKSKTDFNENWPSKELEWK